MKMDLWVFHAMTKESVSVSFILMGFGVKNAGQDTTTFPYVKVIWTNFALYPFIIKMLVCIIYAKGIRNAVKYFNA
jgi:hypothetical protein